jgi:hypothetical protein
MLFREAMLYNNPAAPERSQVIGEMQRLSASGERERYAAQVVGEGTSRNLFALSRH